jgi:hypothetical protein
VIGSITSTSHLRTLPSSPALTSVRFKSVQATREMLPSIPVNVCTVSCVCSAGSSAILTICIRDIDPMKGSLEMAAIVSPKLKATALHGSWKLKVAISLPVCTSHSFAVLSAEPVMSLTESSAQFPHCLSGPSQADGGSCG